MKIAILKMKKRIFIKLNQVLILNNLKEHTFPEIHIIKVSNQKMLLVSKIIETKNNKRIEVDLIRPSIEPRRILFHKIHKEVQRISITLKLLKR